MTFFLVRITSYNVCYTKLLRETLTEDIDISWKLQLAHWDVRFEPAATCWILMPETLHGLWKQRLRWATGGAQAILKYRSIWKQWTKRRMWPVYVEYGLSLAWSYLMVWTVARNNFV